MVFQSGSIVLQEWVDNKIWNHVSDFELMQLVGIKDTNREELYAGDIILDLFTKMVYEVRFGQIPKLGYTGWYAYSKDRSTTLNGDYDSGLNGAIEIIGNIYETPELLTPTVNSYDSRRTFKTTL